MTQVRSYAKLAEVPAVDRSLHSDPCSKLDLRLEHALDWHPYKAAVAVASRRKYVTDTRGRPAPEKMSVCSAFRRQQTGRRTSASRKIGLRWSRWTSFPEVTSQQRTRCVDAGVQTKVRTTGSVHLGQPVGAVAAPAFQTLTAMVCRRPRTAEVRIGIMSRAGWCVNGYSFVNVVNRERCEGFVYMFVATDGKLDQKQTHCT